MPYIRVGKCVYKQNADGSKGKQVGCSETEALAEAHLRTLYANVPEASRKEVDVSAWGLSPDQAMQAGTFLTLFNGKVHEAVTCVTDQLSMRGYLTEQEVKTLTDIKGQMLKLFNEQCPSELLAKSIDGDTLDAIADKELHEASSQLITIKEVDSPYDWVMITSSSFRDREGEIVTQKAHEQDIAWMEKHGYGTLDYWHLHPVVFEYLESKEDVAKLPPFVQKNGVIIGDCTFSAMYKHLRLEAGTYRSKEIKAVMDAHKDEISASLLFFRPKFEPIDGDYYNIHTVSRAAMPKSRVSNLAPYLQGVI